MYCYITGIVCWLLFPFNSSRALHKIIQKCSCFTFCYNVVFHGSHNWIRESNTILVKTSSHLKTFIQFETRFMTKNAKQRRIVTCFRDVSTHIIAGSHGTWDYLLFMSFYLSLILFMKGVFLCHVLVYKLCLVTTSAFYR